MFKGSKVTTFKLGLSEGQDFNNAGKWGNLSRRTKQHCENAESGMGSSAS